jgi:2-methylcitrate dehydratase PrpD
VTTSSYTRLLADFAAGASFEDLPASAVAATQRVTLDTLGCVVGGSDLASSRMVRTVKTSAGGAAEATVLVSGDRLPAASAAHINGHAGNALDAEETIRHSGHLAAATVPPALAMAERQGSTGADLVSAIAVGFDVAARIGLALKHLDVTEDGRVEIAPVSGLSWATFAATVGAGRLLGLDGEQMADAFGLTVACAPLPIAGQWGTQAVPRPLTKYGLYGAMAEAGVFAALLAAEGFRANREALDGERGFWRIMGSSRCEWDALTDRLGSRWLVEETSYKIHPACRFASPALDLFYELQSRAGVTADEIDHVELLVPHAMLVKHMDDPAVETLVDGQFSLPHLIGLAACGGPPGPEWHTPEALRDPRVSAFAERVSVVEYPDAAPILQTLLRTQGHAELIPTAARLTAKGTSFASATDHAVGDPWDAGGALDDATIEAKFRTFCRVHLSQAKIEGALTAVSQLTVAPAVDELVAHLVVDRRSDGGTAGPAAIS